MSKCPYCFHELSAQRAAFRCVSGNCSVKEQPIASQRRGYTVQTAPIVVVEAGSDGTLPVSYRCEACRQATRQEACLYCLYDIPAGWRNANALTVAVFGARGAGKSVWIAVMVEVLRRYVERAGRALTPLNNVTKDLYNASYYDPLLENHVLAGTPVLDQYDAPQRTPLIWRISAGADGGEVLLVIRDMAGEDFEGATEFTQSLTYAADADLAVFMFDPMVLPNVINILRGLIADVDAQKLGVKAGAVFPNLINHINRNKHNPGNGDLALTVTKFDSLHHLPSADTEYAAVMGNPAAQFNRDETGRRRVGPYAQKGPESQQKAREAFLKETEFLDQEIRSLLKRLHEETMTNQADQAVWDGKFREVRHFAVSALGETPQHAERLTEHGISPFRVLDPVLWGLAKRGIWI